MWLKRFTTHSVKLFPSCTFSYYINLMIQFLNQFKCSLALSYNHTFIQIYARVIIKGFLHISFYNHLRSTHSIIKSPIYESTHLIHFIKLFSIKLPPDDKVLGYSQYYTFKITVKKSSINTNSKKSEIIPAVA